MEALREILVVVSMSSLVEALIEKEGWLKYPLVG